MGNYKTPRGKHKYVFDINHSNIFSDLSPKTKEIKEKLNIYGLIKLKTSAQQRK